MAQAITFKRITAGHYQSEDLRVQIIRQEPWGGPTWSIYIDGAEVEVTYTLAAAREDARRIAAARGL